MQKYSKKLNFSPLIDSDGPEVIEIFNYYIKNSDAAFLEEPVTTAFYDRMISLIGSYPSVAVRDEQGGLMGFGMIRPYNPLPAFSHTAEITYFIRPEQTRTGIGRQMLQYLEEKGKNMEISCILAQISSKNENSIIFHQKCGFVECGRIHHAGRKRGEFFDIVWMEKEIDHQGKE